MQTEERGTAAAPAEAGPGTGTSTEPETESAPPPPPGVTEGEGDADVEDEGEEEEEEEEEDPEGAAATSTKRFELEGFTRCSESLLWKLMMRFYDVKGPESWAQGIVPHFITCNAFIGRSYAKVLAGFIRDCMAGNGGGGGGGGARSLSPLTLDPEEPLYIVELGGGAGKFAFFMLRALTEMEDVLDFPLRQIKYIITDFTQSNYDFWLKHDALKPYFDEGRLDVALFDATQDAELRLHHAGITLSPGSCKNPICITANYLFDTLCHDIFQVSEGSIREGLVSTGSQQQEVEGEYDNPEIIKRMNNLFEYRAVADVADYYRAEEGDGEHLANILQWYCAKYGMGAEGASVLLPIGALRAIRRLSRLANNRCVVISGDKGNNNPEHMRGLSDPHVAVHGSFSVMVNYHAIGLYFTSRGGFSLHNPQEEASLKVSCFVLTGDSGDGSDSGSGSGNGSGEGGESKESKDEAKRAWLDGDMDERDARRAAKFPSLRFAFQDAMTQFGPNDFFVLQKSLKEDSPNPPLRAIVSLLKLSDWDSDVFYKFRDPILNQIPNANPKLRADMERGIPRLWENYYLLDYDKDIAFEIGRFYYGIRNYADALRFYQDSHEKIGEHHVTYHNMGLCHYSQGHLEVALDLFEKALRVNPEYTKASTWRKKVRTELASTSPGADEPNSAEASAGDDDRTEPDTAEAEDPDDESGGPSAQAGLDETT